MGTNPSGSSKVDDWSALQQRLAEVLAMMGTDGRQHLIIEDRGKGRFVQFAVEAESALLVEPVSNDFLRGRAALSGASCRAIVELGGASPAERWDKDGSERANFTRIYERPVDFAEVARLAVRTVRDVFQVPSPGGLEYDAFAEKDGAPILLPALGLAGMTLVVEPRCAACGKTASRIEVVPPGERPMAWESWDQELRDV